MGPPRGGFPMGMPPGPPRGPPPMAGIPPPGGGWGRGPPDYGQGPPPPQGGVLMGPRPRPPMSYNPNGEAPPPFAPPAEAAPPPLPRLQVVDNVTKDLLFAFDQRLAGDLPMDAVELQRRLTKALALTAIPRGRVARPGFLRGYVTDFANVGALETANFGLGGDMTALMITGVRTKVVAQLCRELQVYEHRSAIVRNAMAGGARAAARSPALARPQAQTLALATTQAAAPT
eukprot:CAMPEP_0118872226 /NCGR_PEP_ID=MMETSP1163-20130328/14499_1 /TAXON_ID=124430 /ORGANISM="Phaeomonas parva, Strain CCMP2877" /LENGTH=230 /DNA_ID=CAMNT_0006807395 /DNA_START=1 /DNA_END=690 /DNA_ORIENTATION=+